MRWETVLECNFCGSRNANPFLRIETPNWYDGRALQLLECADCRLVRASPRPERRDLYRHQLIGTTKSLSPLKKKLSRPNAVSGHRGLIREAEKAAKRPVKKLFEFGCGAGTVLMCAQKLGIEAEGNDVNSVAIRMLNELGIKARHGFTSELDFHGTKFDAVVGLGYLQESYEPFDDLKRSHELLNTGGVVYLKNSYLGCPEHKASGEAWRVFGANNFHYYHPETFRAMLDAAGFKMLDMRLRGMTMVVLALRED
jgi:hypothetical protein